jgi:hypothetical protein
VNDGNAPKPALVTISTLVGLVDDVVLLIETRVRMLIGIERQRVRNGVRLALAERIEQARNEGVAQERERIATLTASCGHCSVSEFGDLLRRGVI